MKRINKYCSVEEIDTYILHFKLEPITPTVSEFREFLDYIRNKIKSIPTEKKIAMIFDTPNYKLINDECRVMAGEGIKDFMEAQTAACIFYNHSFLVYVVIRGISLIYKIPFPVITTISQEKAIEKAREILTLQK